MQTLVERATDIVNRHGGPFQLRNRDSSKDRGNTLGFAEVLQDFADAAKNQPSELDQPPVALLLSQIPFHATGFGNLALLEKTHQLLKDENPLVRSAAIEATYRVIKDNPYFPHREKDPSLPLLLLEALEKGCTRDDLRKVLEMYAPEFADPRRLLVSEQLLPRFETLIEKNVSKLDLDKDLLAAAASFFSTTNSSRVSTLLNANLAEFSVEELGRDNRSILRYLLEHSPKEQVVRTAQKVFKEYWCDNDKNHEPGLLESALRTQSLYWRAEDLSLVSHDLKRLCRAVFNLRLSPTNFSKEAAVKEIIFRLECGYPKDAIEIPIYALVKSGSVTAFDYIEKQLKRAKDYMAPHELRRALVLRSLRDSPEPRAKEILKKYTDT